MSEQNTFRNLMKLQAAREAVAQMLKSDYDSVVVPCKNIINKVAEANNENHFSAMGRILKHTDLAKGDKEKLVFAAALMDIVLEKDLKDFPQE